MRDGLIPTVETWVDGERELGVGERRFALHDPNQGTFLADFAGSSPQQVERAISAADRAHRAGVWRSLGPEGRAPVLFALAEQLDRRASSIAELDSINSGVPISVTRLMAQASSDVTRDAARRALAAGETRVLEAGGRDVAIHRVPWGTTALILPWNAPAATAVKKLAFALAAGAPVVMKPSSASPWSAALIAEAAHEAGVPNGVVNLVAGGAEVGAQLVEDIRVRAISMTGSTATGRSIAMVAAPRFARLNLELGSNNPALVLSDVDVEMVAESIVSGSAKLSGQWCEAPRRVFVARDIWRDFVAAVAGAYKRQVIGSSLDERTTLGPVAFPARQAELRDQRRILQSAEVEVLTVDGVPADGCFFEPTIISGERMPSVGEMFGPMLTVEPYDEENEAIERANSGQTGLAGYVFGADSSRALALARKIVAGEVKVNGTSVLDLAPESMQSFFGESGLGGHGDAGLLEFFSGAQIVGVDAPGLLL